MESPMFEEMIQSLYTFALFGAFILGGLVSWLTKDYVDAYLDNAAYAKAITHPEMLDEQGNVDQTELLYLSFNEQDDTIEQDED